MTLKKRIVEDFTPSYETLIGSSRCNLITTEELPEGTVKTCRLDHTIILFTIKGSGILSLDRTKKVLIGQGSAVVIPITTQYLIEAQSDLECVVFVLDDRLSYRMLCDSIAEADKSGSVRGNPYVLQMNDKLWIFITNTLSFLEDGLSHPGYQKMKVEELFHVLIAYSPPEILLRFLAPLLSRTASFAGMIYDNWDKVGSLDELAGLTGLSLSGFSKRFRKIFDISPYQWIMEKKSERILLELLEGGKSIRQLTEEYEFHSVQHFGYYCKKRFGLPPGKIRRKSKSGPTDR